MVKASHPLTVDEIRDALAKDGLGPTPVLRIVARELRSDAVTYRRLEDRWIHIDNSERLEAQTAKAQPRSVARPRTSTTADGRERSERPLGVRIERLMLDASHPLSPDEIVVALAQDGLGPAPALQAIERELRSDAATYRRSNDRWIHIDNSEANAVEAAERQARSTTRRRTARTELVERWLEKDPRLWRWQAEALACWEANERRGIVSAVTGAGKTNVAISAMVEHVSSGGCAVVVVPTQDLMHQWAARIRDWSPRIRRIGKLDGSHRDTLPANDVLVTVVNTAAKRLPRELTGLLRPPMLVADECHRYGADSFRWALRGPYVATLGLSATPDRSGDDGTNTVVIPAIGEVVYELGYERALSDGVIADFEVSFVGLKLDSHARVRYESLTTTIGLVLREVYDSYPHLEDSPYLYHELEKLFQSRYDDRIVDLFRATTARQELLQNAPARMRFVRWLATTALPGARGIAFHSRIEACEEIASVLRAAGIEASVHHSALPKSERKRALRSFALGRTRMLCSPRTLDEGIDVPDADFAILVAGSTVNRQRIQRLGRVLRKADGKALARGFILFIEDTVEDPRQRDNAFARELQDLSRATWWNWPEDKHRMSASWRP